MNLPDYSEYLKQPGMLAFIEQEWKNNPKMHNEHAKVINDAIPKYGIEEAIEFGCGTGEVAKRLDVFLNYTGVDFNDECIKIAEQKAGNNMFSVGDIRTSTVTDRYDLVFCFGFLKHFGLHEWYDIFKKVSSFGEYFIFDMPIGETKDDGVEFHHVWKSLKDLSRDVEGVGFNILSIINPDSVEPIFICKRKTNAVQS